MHIYAQNTKLFSTTAVVSVVCLYLSLIIFRVFYQSQDGTPFAEGKHYEVDERSVPLWLRDIMCQRTDIHVQYIQLQVTLLI